MNIGPRRLDVALCLVKGYNNEKISRHLGMSIATVKSHLRHLCLGYQIEDNLAWKRLHLATAIAYELHPHLIPFSDGDRAAALGLQPANEFARSKLAIEAESGNTPAEYTRRVRARNDQRRNGTPLSRTGKWHRKKRDEYLRHDSSYHASLATV